MPMMPSHLYILNRLRQQLFTDSDLGCVLCVDLMHTNVRRKCQNFFQPIKTRLPFYYGKGIDGALPIITAGLQE